MGFEDSALTRLRRYHEEAGRSLDMVREAEEAARGFAGRLFSGLEYTVSLASEAGFEAQAEQSGSLLTLRVLAGEGASLTLGVVPGAAAETDEDLMHEELSRYDLDPSGYSGRVLGFSPTIGEQPCQTFAVYRDGVWKTRGIFVERARGKTTDSDEILHGFCLRIVGRLIDLAALTGGAGRKWASDENYTLDALCENHPFPTKLRLPR